MCSKTISPESATDAHPNLPPSNWVRRFADMIPKNGSVLDIACGAGRHSRFLAAMGLNVVAVDRDVTVFVDPPDNVTLIQADLETHPWPFDQREFAGVIVTNYLHRPLLPLIVSSVACDGLLIYETFAVGNEKFGRPSRADFLLQPGELLNTVHDKLEVIAYENIFVSDPKPAMVQRISARRFK
jgi:SAM-dependent methyltransferase